MAITSCVFSRPDNSVDFKTNRAVHLNLNMIRFCGAKNLEGHQFLALCSFVLVVIIVGEGMMVRVKLDRERFFALATILLFMQIFSMTTASARLNDLFWKFTSILSKKKSGDDTQSCEYNAHSFQTALDMNLSRADNAIQLLRYLISTDLSEDSKSCLMYCIDVFKSNPEQFHIPQVLLENSKRGDMSCGNKEMLASAELDAPVTEWLISQCAPRNLEQISIKFRIDCIKLNDLGSSVQDWLLSQFSRDSTTEKNERAQQRKSFYASHGTHTLSSVVNAGGTDMTFPRAHVEKGRSTLKCTGSVSVPQSYGTGILYNLEETCSRLNDRGCSEYDLPFKVSHEQGKAITGLLHGVDGWNWDIFKLREASGGRELQVLGWHILRYWGLDRTFGLDPGVLQNWLAFVEGSYGECEYHNATHAADVLQTVHFMLCNANAKKFLRDHEVLALILAAMIHDMSHDGFTNSFHKNRLTDRALLYNDQSIQENFHVRMMFQTMALEPDKNIFHSLPALQFCELRRLLILLVLSTDMNKHFSLLQEMRILLTSKGQDPEAWEDSTDSLLCFLLHSCDVANQVDLNGEVFVVKRTPPISRSS